ncbi:MAG: glycosyltransferase family 4 protein [Candidatus Bathyarchaeia archaeon]
MRICLLSRGFNGLPTNGISSFTYYFSKALVRLGHEVHIFTDQISARSSLETNGIWIHSPQRSVLSLNKYPIGVVSDRVLYAISVSRTIPRVAKNYRIDVVESPDWYGESSFLCYKEHMPPIVLRCHTPLSLFLTHFGYKNLYTKIASRFEEIPIMKANSVISTSKALANYLMSKCNRCPNHIIYNGIDASFIKSLPDLTFREKWRIGQCPMILCIGSINRSKGSHLLLRIVNRILETDRLVKIVFTGSLPQGSLQALYNTVKPSYRERVIFTGWLPYVDFVSAVAACDIVAQPSLWESCSYATLEAMSLGKAILASKVGGLPEMIVDGESGLLFEPEDDTALVRGINLLLADSSLREKLGRNAQLRVQELFNDEIMAKNSVSVYRKLLDQDCS